MILNYFKIAFRNILKHKGYSFINIFGLATGMAVAILIGLWVFDEVSFDTYHKNQNSVMQIMQNLTNNGKKTTQPYVPYPLAEELRKSYGSDFKSVALTTGVGSHLLTLGNNKISKQGIFAEPQFADMLTLKMIKGSSEGLKEPGSVILSASLSSVFFGNEDPLNKIIKINNELDVKVTGVYEDLPENTTFHDMAFVAPWALYFNNTDWIKKEDDPWRPNAFQIYAQLTDKADVEKVSFKIKNAKLNKVNEYLARKKPELFLLPMSRWHLYSEYKDGVNTGGKIEYVRLIGIISIFVLILACINFMNLSTARSEKRAKEVGIRKAIGSLRSQLIGQFLSESIVVVGMAFIISLLLVQLSLAFFNDIASKHLTIPFGNIIFWLTGIAFCLLIGLISGSYPALYLSSFQPIKVLKGTFKAGRFAAVPRKVLVVVQFAVSVTLVIGTIIVFKQIQYAKNRPIGYNANGLISISVSTPEFHKHQEAIRRELIQSGAVTEIAEASNPTTAFWGTTGGIEWRGKDPAMTTDLPITGISYNYAQVIGWKFKEGRNFSKDFASDSSAVIINEAAARFMGFTKPVGEVLKWFGRPATVIGVVPDMVVNSPYEAANPIVYFLSNTAESIVLARINTSVSASAAVEKLEATFKKFNPTEPFEYRFADEDFNKKFADEERVGKIATSFAILAILISCLGLFGLASFMAEQRTKEIGVRKVLGATVFGLWQLLSKDFVMLVVISIVIASPVAYYFMNQWIGKFSVKTDISWWVFAITALGAVLITLLTVSYQAIKAALMNPVKTLKTD
ncbi:ABC transporter permease [Emticicia fluvialis]|uniref:ABC transporter permease n=1 Tax=Emticicia fluvialis TaxID=2974474 RepID=UPI002164FAA0|nr:ABC transporter permease [Emticicia fluvialis]